MSVTNVQQKISINLNGEWNFNLDSENNQSWSGANGLLPEQTIQIPGSWEEQGFGNPSGHHPIGTWKKKHEYEGVAWYVKEIEIPDSCAGRDLFLVLKGVRWLTEVWIDDQYAGKQDSIISPHRYSVTPYVQVGKKHRFVIKVDNRMRMDLQESHIHSYHTSTYWGGITGGIELEAQLPYSIEKVNIESHINKKRVDLKVSINRKNCQNQNDWSLDANVLDKNGNVVAKAAKKLNQDNSVAFLEELLSLDFKENPELWSPTNPYLYKLELKLKHEETEYDQKEYSFGFRSFETSKNQFLLNEQPIFLTGYVDCCIFPQTGYPIWDKEHYLKQFKTVKSYGFNHVRLHGWNPPEPFWEAADETGMLVQTELPHWSQFYRAREKDAPEEVQQFFKRELENLLNILHTHPSFVMLSLGNELTSEEGHNQLNELVRYARELDFTRLYTDNTGFGELPANDREGDFYIPTLNWHPPYNIDHAAGPDTTFDYREVTRLDDKPLIAHEHGQFTMYVRPEEASKYEGVLQPNWLETTNDTLAKKGLDQRLGEFQEATGIHLVRSLKETMEKARRTPALSGIQLLDIRDFPGQGHATVGILDVFWDSKNIVEPNAFCQFNEQTVLLMRSRSRTVYNGEMLSADLEASHFGEALKKGTLKWTLSDHDAVIQEEQVDVDHISGEGLTALKKIAVPIPKGAARKLVLRAELEADGKVITNEWDFWAFPHNALPENKSRIWTNMRELRAVLYGARFEDTIGMKQHSFHPDNQVDLVITDQLSRDIIQHIVDGGSVWMMAKENNQYDEVFTRYLPTFWNYMWFPEQKGTTMGMRIHEHPALHNYPTDGFSDWHWYHLVDRTPAINLDHIPEVEPIIEVVDNFNRAKRLAYAFEARVGRGKLFVTTLNFSDKASLKLPEVNHLFLEFIHYLNSNQFQPEASITLGDLLGTFKVKSLFTR
ncbi:sugar-binding domain-containing protein [Gracilibacillus sp. YIM 98692]|uniref:glycoside hydrolase family 2 protein n=1 Tax=Gracilibacillus sp. YIM 98692 TaxID=2663532 RepID=UPI0013D38433|nr:sugar-binding domain-containing protein [Gracilibacillus sp. YIM 98692]